MAKPISPDDVKNFVKTVPDVVIEIVNDLLLQGKRVNVSKQYIKIDQDEVVSRLEACGFDRHAVFDDHMLDFEDHYRQAGWKVTYDKPAYYESYGANWVFEPK